MGRYRKIDPRIWNDQKFRSFSDNAKLSFLFILTHPYMTSLGAMRTTVAGLAEELHWELKAFTKAFQEPLAKGMLKYDFEACCLVIPNFLKYNPPENPNVVKSWEKIVDLIPECQLKVELFEYVKDFLKVFGEPFLKAMPKELERVCQNPNPSPNPSPNPIEDPPLTPPISKKPSRKTKTSLPENFGISESVQKWAKENGHTRIEERLESFKDWALSNGAQKVDWDATLRRAIREDWAKIGGNGQVQRLPALPINKADQVTLGNLAARDRLHKKYREQGE